MRFKLLFVFISTLIIPHVWSKELPALEKIKKLSLVNGCRIYNYSGNWVKTIPGNVCLFTDDGTVISGDDKFLRRYNNVREVMWEIPGHFHHQINFSTDGSKILTLSSELVKDNNEYIRYDTFKVISLDGKILHELSSKDLLAKTNQKRLSTVMSGALKSLFNSSIEATHFNSIYEIPEVTNRKVPSYIKKGNIILNSIELGIYILSPDLGQVLHFQQIGSAKHIIHDVQVRQNGNVLLFNNRADDGSTSLGKYSSIQEIDLSTGKIVFEFAGNPKGIFFSPFCGGVQDLDNDLIVFSHVTSGAYFYSRSKKTLLATVPGYTGNDQVLYPGQQVKGYYLNDFIRNWEK